MWPLTKRVSPRDAGLPRGFTDWHCHLLPGVDDGVRTLEEALRVLAAYERLGVKEAWLTPHVMEDMPNTPAELRQRFATLRAAYHGSVRLRLAAENMLDSLFEERLERDDLLPLGDDGRHLLVETSYFNPPMGLHDILRRVKAKGYHPVLAHPERYLYMEGKDYAALKEMGVLFQLNLFSLAGLYGQHARKKATHLLRKGMYDLMGTDTHKYEPYISLADIAFLSPRQSRAIQAFAQ